MISVLIIVVLTSQIFFWDILLSSCEIWHRILPLCYSFASANVIKYCYVYSNFDMHFYFCFIKRYVGGNPFQCTCDLGRFVMFLQRKEILPYNKNYLDEPKCSSLVYLKGKEIVDVPYHNMSCNSTFGTYITICLSPISLFINCMWHVVKQKW